MPRLNDREKAKALLRVSEYLQDLKTRSDVARKAYSHQTIARVLNISRDTIRKHNLGELIATAKREDLKAEKKAPSKSEQRIIDAIAERDQWQTRYANLLEKYATLEFYLRNHSTIDVDAVLDGSVPKAMRAAPARRRSAKLQRGYGVEGGH